MTSKIHILNELTINQIAAGEVIENAASVVKELVENAIDAKARNICITTKAGGRQLICVQDDGVGMNEIDLDLCIERHATSKIVSSADLYKLSTLGFRGEALSTIASVSKMSIATAHLSHKSDAHGLQLFVEGGKRMRCVPTPRQRGTTVEVTHLFYNTPARREFQKSLSSDTLEIHKTFVALALSHLDIGFEWVHDEKMQFQILKNMPLEERLKLLLGKTFNESQLPLQIKKKHFCLEGLVGEAHKHHPNKTQQYLFVNNRFVTSPFISSCVLEGYGHRLPPQRFPCFVLYLTTAPEEIDVNIHPKKKEIRFQKEQEIKRLILDAVKLALEGHYAPKIVSKITLPPSVPLSFPLPQLGPQKQEQIERDTSFAIVHQMNDYLFVKVDDGIMIVQQKRARERIFFDRLKNQKVSAQQLLFPISLEMNHLQFNLLEPHLPRLQKFGLNVRSFGGTTVVVDALPEMLDENEVHNLLHQLVDELGKGSTRDIEDKIPLAFCRAIRKKEFSLHESVKIVETLLKSEKSMFTPLGQPIYFKITEQEIEKWLT